MKPEGITDKQWIKYNVLFIVQHFIGIKNAEKYFGKTKAKLFEEISQNPGIQNRAITYYNEDVTCDNVDEILQNRPKLMEGPLLFKGAAKDWECTQKWSKEFFQKYYANQEVILVGSKGLTNKEHQNKFKKETLGEFIESATQDVKNYLRFSRIIDTDPTLRSHINVSWLEKFKSKLSKGGNLYMFMGEGGSKTDMHAAMIQSLFIQVQGRKKWTIYPANERIFVDTYADRRPYYYTDANPNDENDPKYPLLKYAKKYVITLDPGDVLWFPTFYWHYVENENTSTNIGITYKFTDFNESFKMSKVLTGLLFFITKPTIVAIFFYNLIKKKDLHFDKDI
jgi:hypothetical protein